MRYCPDCLKKGMEVELDYLDGFDMTLPSEQDTHMDLLYGCGCCGYKWILHTVEDGSTGVWYDGIMERRI